MAGGKTPLELLEHDPTIELPFLSPLMGPGVGAILAIASSLFANFGLKRPLLSGIQRHIILGAIGGGVGYYFDKRRDNFYAERDAVFRHYIQLHPEDFPAPERRKIGDLFSPWAPIR